KAGGFIGFGLPLAAYCGLLYVMFMPKKQSMHGDARFATAGDLSKKDMFKSTPTSIVVGKYNGRLVQLSGQQFVILAAPTRSGKGVGIVIPNLLNYQA
ncbi:type IV secretory system conjugative DNA transfer family protein, partial [Lysobacter sp. 2RAB21]